MSRAIKKGVFVCGQCFSAEGLLTIDGMIFNTVVEGSMHCDWFLEDLEFDVILQTLLVMALFLLLY